MLLCVLEVMRTQLLARDSPSLWNGFLFSFPASLTLESVAVSICTSTRVHLCGNYPALCLVRPTSGRARAHPRHTKRHGSPLNIHQNCSTYSFVPPEGLLRSISICLLSGWSPATSVWDNHCHWCVKRSTNERACLRGCNFPGLS